MTFSRIIGVVTGISGSAAVFSYKSLNAKQLIDCHECHVKRLPKAKELPLYDQEEDLSVEYDEKNKMPLISEISTVRQQFSGVASYLSGFKEEVVHIYKTGVAHSQSTYNYITSEENKLQRILAITSGGIAGYLFARKRGLFKKLLFTSTGSTVVFSALYPTLAKEYASTGWEHTKSQTSNILEKYGGYDTEKLADETNQKLEKIKRTLKLEGLTDQLKIVFEKNKEKVNKSLSSVTGKEAVKEELPETSSKDPQPT